MYVLFRCHDHYLLHRLAAYQKKLIVVGGPACGKHSLVSVFAKDEFSDTYIPTVFEHYISNIKVDGKMFQLALWTTAGEL